MVRLINFRAPRSWLAGLLMFLAGGAVIWHLLACVESPMAFSPDGKRLAFTTMEPYGDINDFDKMESIAAGNHTFRVMVLEDGREPRLVDEAQDAMFSAPAWSPDGKRLVYLRIPLLPSEKTSPPSPEEQPASSRIYPIGTLVIRNASDLSMIQSQPLELWGLPGHPDQLFNNYRAFRPFFNPDGTLLYVGDVDEHRGMLLHAIDPTRGSQHIVAPGGSPTLSPDGKYLAAFGDQGRTSVYLIPTDGQPARAILPMNMQPNMQPSWSGLSWLDSRTLALLGPVLKEGEGNHSVAELSFVRTDGSAAPAAAKLRADMTDYQTGELAISADGQHIVAAFGSTVFFMDATGKANEIWTAQGPDRGKPDYGGWLVQPSFTPDSRFVAFKRVAVDGKIMIPVFSDTTEDGAMCGDVEMRPITRTTEIVFFTPDGKEVRSIPVPAARGAEELVWQLPK